MRYHYMIALTIAGAVTACDRASDSSTVATAPTLLAPAGLEQLNDQPWNSVAGNGWSYRRRTSAKDADIVSDGSAPFSPDHVLRMIFTPDMPRDTEPSVHWIELPRSKEVYTGWWIKLSSNWVGSPAGACKMTFLWAAPSGQGQVYTALLGSSEPHHVGVNTEWAPYSQKIWEPNVSLTEIRHGEWHRVDWYVRWPTAAGVADGVMRWWVDGTLNGNYIDVRFPDGGDGFHQFEFAPTIQIPPPAEQYMYVDHAFVRTR